MSKIFAALLILSTAISSHATSISARERVALVIGNGEYQSIATLPNPTRDAADLADTMGSLGFKVTTAIDADQESMRNAVKRFGEELVKAGPDAVGFFFYAGHAVQVQGANYLIPTDASIANETQLTQQSVHLSEIAHQMNNANIAVSFMVIDACRNNPFAGNVLVPGGLAQIRAPRGSIIAYSTEPGAVALDGEGQNSPYTAALIQEIVKPGIPVEQMFKRVRRRLLDATAFQQISWESSSLTEDLYFVVGSETGHDTPQLTDTQPKHEVDWDRYEWQDLTAAQRDNWSVLDWTVASWNGAAPVPASEFKIWDKLSPAQQKAAASLGYSKSMWDGTPDSAASSEIVKPAQPKKTPVKVAQVTIDWDKYDWGDMTASQQGLWSALGWDNASWSGAKAAPKTETKGWNELSTHQRDAAAKLGFSKSSWDAAR